MERSHLESPAGLPCGLVCHEEHEYHKLSPEKLSRPQKRRRRAERCAVRSALVLTTDLKQNIGLNLSSEDGAGLSQNLASKLFSLECKLDHLLMVVTGMATFPYTLAEEPPGTAPLGLDPADAVLDYFQSSEPNTFTPNADADPFIPGASSEKLSSGCNCAEKVEALQTRVTSIENQLEEVQCEATQAADDLAASFKHLEEHIDVDLMRVRAQVEHDFSRCMKAYTQLEASFMERLVGDGTDVGGRDGQKGSAARPPCEKKIDLTIDLPMFNPMQRGLFRQIGGTINTLVMEKRIKHLEELHNNLSGQRNGPAKDQQLQVLKELERQLHG